MYDVRRYKVIVLHKMALPELLQTVDGLDRRRVLNNANILLSYNEL